MCEKKLVPKLRFSGFNDEWSINKLDEISSLTSSKRIYSSDYVETGIPFYRGAEITQLKNNEEIKEKLFISTEKYNELKNKFGAPKKDDILVTGVGTLGNVYKIRDNAEFYFKDGNLIWIKDITINPDFLELYLETFKNEMLKLAIGSTQKALTIVSLEKLKVKYPNIQEQRKIANFFEVLDNKIRLLSEKYNYYIDFKKYLMQQIFAQKLRFDKQNEWKTVEIKSVVSEYKEKAGDNEYPILSSTLSGIFLQSDYFDKNVNSSDTQDYKVVPKGFFTYRSMSDTGVFRFNIQNIVEKGIISPAYPVFTTENINDMFLEQYLNNSPYIKRQILTLKEGGTRYALGFNKFKKLKIEVPSVNEQNKIADCFNTVDTKINHVDNELKNINNFKKGLLQQMFV